MPTLYYAAVDADGKITMATSVILPDEYTAEAPEEAYLNAGRAQLTEAGWVIHPELSASLDKAQPVQGETVTASVEVPADSPSSDATFVVQYGSNETEPVLIPFVAGAAEHSFQFDEIGRYTIRASTKFNGSAFLEVDVIEQAVE